MKWLPSTCLALTLAAAPLLLSTPARAEPTDPVVIGWWSYFSPEGPAYQVPTPSTPDHPITVIGGPPVYYYEPSGGHGLQEKPNILPPDQAWKNIIAYTLAHANNASLSPDFTIDTGSDLQSLQQAYFGWAFVLLYVPKDKYCDTYRVHVGTVDDGIQAMVNAKIVGYATLGEQNKYIDMVEYGSMPPKLVLRPGINEVVLIHVDQAKVQRYVHNVWIEHNGVQIPLAPKNIAWGQVADSVSKSPIYGSTVGITGPGVTDSFVTGPFGFYFFAGLANGSYALTANAAGYKSGMAAAAVAMGQATTEVVRSDFALELGCTCPDMKVCGPSGGCLDPCVKKGEFGETCTDPAAVCVNHACVVNPCDTLVCKPGFTCTPVSQGNPPQLLGLCVEVACSNVCCTAGQVCSAGLCVADNCGGGCAAGKTCAGGNCVDSCSVLTCAGQLACVGGACVDPCKADPTTCGMTDGGFGAGGGFVGASGGSGGGGATTGAGGAPGGGSIAAAHAGCGCRVEAEDDAAAGAIGFGLGLGLVLVARRRRRR